MVFMMSDFNLEDVEELFVNKEPKDLKRSIRNKYNRRLRYLAHTIDDYIFHAEQRLDKEKAGKIRNKNETEELLEKCKKLREIIPVKYTDENQLSEDDMKRISENLEIPFSGDADEY